MTVAVRAYLSPTLVLLAMDWEKGKTTPDFLGFAVCRTPGFLSADGQTREKESWLPNRVTFNGPVPSGRADAPSKDAPIQKFMWWDARIEPSDRNGNFIYTVYPVTGTSDNPILIDHEATTCQVTLPDHIVAGIGTWFNRAVLSSQAFTRKLHAMGLTSEQAPPADKALVLREWLANDMNLAFGSVLEGATRIAGAIYHLTDRIWAIPQLAAFAEMSSTQGAALVYDAHKASRIEDSPNQRVVDELNDVINFYPRDKTAIMHNKFLVSDGPKKSGKSERVLMGSANYTTGGFTTQANLMHIFESSELARLYNERAFALSSNPTIGSTATLSPAWSQAIKVGTASVRAGFSPEPKNKREQIDAIVAAINQAKHSVLFCIFTPTDKALRDACFAAGDRGLMMFGIVNNISETSAINAGNEVENGATIDNAKLANMELYHRRKNVHDVIEGAYFSKSNVPEGFETELRLFPGDKGQDFGNVVIHHKFIVIDAEGDNPIVYTGSANMSENAQHNNDENILEIKDAHIASIYMAEFMRLYEHYRARAIAIKESDKPRRKLILQPNRSWADKYYIDGSPEEKSRVAMASSTNL